MNADTHQPIEGVQVMRISTGRGSRVMDPVKGAQALISRAPVTTSKDGCFAMDSTRSLTPFGRTARYAVSLTFAHPDYERISASYMLANPSNAVGEEPAIDVGEVLLVPRSKRAQ
ncbi:MAG TPA: hypothetical protein VN673_08095 [Clostridia bacterium]|nr:hypothetical protein [Clostridia bacterium]